MTSANGSRRRAKPGDVRKYHMYRDQGLTIEDAARAVGFRKSWGYQRDQERRQTEKEQETEPMPADDLSDAVELVVAERTGDDERALGFIDRFGGAVVPYLCRLVWYLAAERAGNLNDELELLLEGEPMAAELAAAPLTPQDILEQIPLTLKLARGGDPISWRWMPPRARAWIDDLLASHDDLADIEAQARQALSSGDPEALRNLRHKIWTGGANWTEEQTAEDDSEEMTQARGRMDA